MHHATLFLNLGIKRKTRYRPTNRQSDQPMDGSKKELRGGRDRENNTELTLDLTYLNDNDRCGYVFYPAAAQKGRDPSKGGGKKRKK